VLGGVYAISAVGLVLTYKASHIFNFAHGAIAFFVASCFYELNTRRGWSIAAAAVLSIGIIGPVVGLALWAVLFRRLTHASPTIKLVATVGLFVAIPPATQFIFGDEQIFRAPGLAGNAPDVVDILGTRLDADQLIIFGAALTVAVVLTLFLRFTGFGLSVRGVVDSQTMSELVGTNSKAVSAATWAIGCFLAGLAGVLVAPIINLSPGSYAVFVIASFAAAVIARMESLTLAFVGALLVGVIQGLSVKFLPSDGILSHGVRPSIPFAVMAVFLLIYSNLGKEPSQPDLAGAATRGAHHHRPPSDRAWWLRGAPYLLGAVVLLLGPQMLDTFWIGIVAGGLALAIIFLSFTVVTGEGGMISLCQISFAGVGAIATGQLASEHGWPIGIAILAGGLIAVPFGMLVAMLAVRLGDLYLALATLSFALLLDNIIFRIEDFDQVGAGVFLNRPAIGSFTFDSDDRFYYLLLAVFVVLALLIANLRRSTTGLELGAVRSSETATATIGVSVVGAKLTAFSLSAFIAGIGGGLLATYRYLALPSDYNAILGIVWLAVVVTWGIRSPWGALVAGMALPVISQLVSDNLEPRYVLLTAVAFGLGAIGLAREPRGMLALQGQQLRGAARWSQQRLRRTPTGIPE